MNRATPLHILFAVKRLPRLLWTILVCCAALSSAAQAAVTITRKSAPILYVGTAAPQLAAYAAYDVTSTVAVADAWVKWTATATGGSANVIGTATNENGLTHIGPLAANTPKTVFFYLQATSAATATTLQSHTVGLYEGSPTAGGTLQAASTFTLSVESTISAAANKVTVITSSPNPPPLGGTLVVTVEGDTGQMGSAKIVAFTPASQTSWPSNVLELVSTTVTLTGGNTGTFSNTLAITPAATSDTHYVIRYTFRAINTTSSSTAVNPVGYISSGGQVKFTGSAPASTLNAVSSTTTLTKSVSPTSLIGGGTATFTVTATNTSSGAVTLDGFYDTLPAGTSYVAGSSTYAGSAISNPSISGQNLSWGGLYSVPAGGSASLTYQVSFPGMTGTYTNSVYALMGDARIDRTLDTADTAPATATVNVGTPDLTLTKTHTGNFIQGQTGATYSLTVRNSGTASTSGTVTVTDTLPGGLTATAISGTGWTCTLSTLTCTRSDALANGSSYPAITLTVNVATNAPASVTNSAAVSGGSQTNTANDTASDPTTISTAIPDMTITKSHTGTFAQTQTGATYTLTATNSGTAPTSGMVSLSDTLPTGLSATAISGTGWTCTLGTLSCTRPDALAAGASFPAITLTVDVAANAPTTVTNTASVSGGGQTNTANDTASDPTTITAALPDLTLTKAHTGSFTVGLPASFTFTVNNIAAGTAVGTITLTDVLPSGLTLPNGPVTLTGTNAADWSCSSSSNTVTCTSTVNISGGGSSTFMLSGIVVGGAAVPSVTNTASVSNAGETATGNNAASDTAAVLQTDLRITKTHGLGFGPGGSGRYTITVSNAGTAPSSGAVSVTDLLPASLSAVAIGGPGWSCTLATLSCTRSDSLAAGASYPVITLDVTVSSSPPASATNTVDVSGGNDANTGNNSAQDVTSIPTTFTGYTVSGAVYSDLNANGQRDPGETGVAGVTLTLKDSGGTVLTTASSDAGGLYSFPGLVPGSYAVLRTAVSGAIGTSPDALNVSVTSASVSGVDFGVFAGLKLSGQLFLDDGWGGTAAQANDALRNGTEAGLSGLRVTVSNAGGTLASATSDGSGRYTVYVAGSAGNVTVRADPKQGRSYTATGLNDAVTVLHAATSASDPLASQSTLDAASLAGQSVTRNFALVPLSALTPDSAQTVSSPGSVLYRQRLTAGTPGTLTFSLTPSSPSGSPFSYQLWQDLNGNGVVDPATDALLLRSAGDTASVALSSGSARVTGGSLADLQLIVTVAVPAGIAAGLSDPVRLSVTQTLANLSGVTRVSAITDTTTTGAGGLKLTKYVRNVSAGSGFDPVSADAQSGDTLEYCIVYQNLGAAALEAVDLTDPVPSFTTTLDGYGVGLGVQHVPKTLVAAGQTMTPGTPANALTSAADGDAGTLTPSLLRLNLGTVIGGGRGSVCYRVAVQ